jgi:hypothetical protein
MNEDIKPIEGTMDFKVKKNLDKLLSPKQKEILGNKTLYPDADVRCCGWRDMTLFEELCSGKYKHCGGYFLNHKGEYN